MPVFEEKLISPFAIRFSQEHIRTTFRDGRVVEETIPEIKEKPGVEDFDVILEAPFPDIEIARWAPKGPERDGEHWFTLDNRRLYCLQRAAAALWPKTVAVVVQILYDDAGHMWKKYDSLTYGRSVSIAHRLKGPELSRWDWYREFIAGDFGSAMARTAKVVLADDDKDCVDDLIDIPAAPGSLMAMVRLNIDASTKTKHAASGASTEEEDADSLVELARRQIVKLEKPGGESQVSSDTEDTEAGSSPLSSSCSDSDEPSAAAASDASVLHGFNYGMYAGYGGYGPYDAYGSYGGYGTQLGYNCDSTDAAAYDNVSIAALQAQARAHMLEAQRLRMQMTAIFGNMAPLNGHLYAASLPQRPQRQRRSTNQAC